MAFESGGAAQIQHMQKTLMEMNLQLHHVVSDIIGAIGMRIIRAIVAGERDPEVLAALNWHRCLPPWRFLWKASQFFASQFRFVEEHIGAFPAERLCQVMNLSPRGLRALLRPKQLLTAGLLHFGFRPFA